MSVLKSTMDAVTTKGQKNRWHYATNQVALLRNPSASKDASSMARLDDETSQSSFWTRHALNCPIGCRTIARGEPRIAGGSAVHVADTNIASGFAGLRSSPAIHLNAMMKSN
jgi:hypothetical protein